MRNCKVWSFTKPTPDATTASTRVATFLSELLEVPLAHDAAATQSPEDDLIIVNGSYAFCGQLPALAVAVRHARRIAWVQQDYTIVIPKHTSQGHSPFRAAFRLRHKAGLSPVTIWTTCLPLINQRDRYVNWNSLFYTPLPASRRSALRRGSTRTLLYYGSYRAGRVAYFDRYLSERIPGIRTVISGASDKFERYAHAEILPTIKPRSSMYEVLAQQGLGLYLEDRRSHSYYHSPSTRFYEMLSAGLPMVFQPEAVPMLKKYGDLDVSPYVVTSTQDIRRAMERREEIGAQQRRRWHHDYVGALKRSVHKVVSDWRKT